MVLTDTVIIKGTVIRESSAMMSGLCAAGASVVRGED